MMHCLGQHAMHLAAEISRDIMLIKRFDQTRL